MPLASLDVVTCKFPKCIVSILPLTNSAESTEFDAKSPAAIVASAIKSDVIRPLDINATLLIALSAIFDLLLHHLLIELLLLVRHQYV